MENHRPVPISTADDTSQSCSNDSTPRPYGHVNIAGSSNGTALDLSAAMSVDLEKLNIGPIPYSVRSTRGDSSRTGSLFSPNASVSTAHQTPPPRLLVRNESKATGPEDMLFSPWAGVSFAGAGVGGGAGVEDMQISPLPSMRDSLPPMDLCLPLGTVFELPSNQGHMQSLDPTRTLDMALPEEEVIVPEDSASLVSGASGSSGSSSDISNAGPPTPGVRGITTKSILEPINAQSGDAAVGLLYDQIMEQHFGPGGPQRYQALSMHVCRLQPMVLCYVQAGTMRQCWQCRRALHLPSIHELFAPLALGSHVQCMCKPHV